MGIRNNGIGKGEWNRDTYTEKTLKVEDEGSFSKVCFDYFSRCLEPYCRVEMERDLGGQRERERERGLDKRWRKSRKKKWRD